MGYTDELNAMFPEDEDFRRFSEVLANLTDAEFEAILRKVAPGNPYAEALLANPKKNQTT